jgi:hypothetical protein
MPMRTLIFLSFKLKKDRNITSGWLHPGAIPPSGHLYQ